MDAAAQSQVEKIDAAAEGVQARLSDGLAEVRGRVEEEAQSVQSKIDAAAQNQAEKIGAAARGIQSAVEESAERLGGEISAGKNAQELRLGQVSQKIDVLGNGFGCKFLQENSASNDVAAAFATDSNGVKYLYTALTSMLENKLEASKYTIFIMHSQDVDDGGKSKILELEKLYANVKFAFVDMRDDFKSSAMQIEHIAHPTYYRLKMAGLIPEEFKKVIYLDIDTVVEKDLCELYNVPLNGSCVAGVVAFAYLRSRSYPYLNAGVTLWDLERIRSEGMTDALCALAAENFSSMDQDVMNMAFEGRKMVLPLKFNVMTKYEKHFAEASKTDSDFVRVYGQYNIYEALRSPVIIHYADKAKPWAERGAMFADRWWHYAEKNPFFASAGEIKKR